MRSFGPEVKIFRRRERGYPYLGTRGSHVRWITIWREGKSFSPFLRKAERDCSLPA